MCRKIGVGLRKMFAAKPAAACRQWRWMYALEYQVFGGVDELRFLLCIVAPQHKYDVFALCGQGFDGAVGELFPTVPLMRSGHVGTHGECGVEQQYALPRPAFEVAVWQRFDAEVAANLFVDVAQRWRQFYVFVDRETEPVCLPDAVIGVLPDDDDFDAVERAEVKGVENEARRRKNLLCLVFVSDKIGELHKVGLVKLGGELLFPSGVDAYVHSCFVRHLCAFAQFEPTHCFCVD